MDCDVREHDGAAEERAARSQTAVRPGGRSLDSGDELAPRPRRHDVQQVAVPLDLELPHHVLERSGDEALVTPCCQGVDAGG